MLKSWNCVYLSATHTHTLQTHSFMTTWPHRSRFPLYPSTYLSYSSPNLLYTQIVCYLWCYFYDVFALFLWVMFIVSYVSDYYFCLSHITDCVLSVSLHALLLPCPKCKLYTTTTTDYGCKPFDELICVLFQMQGFSLWSVCTVTSLFPQSALNFWLNLWPQVRFRGCSLPYRS